MGYSRLQIRSIFARAWRGNAKTADDFELPLGEVLRQKKIITEDQLQEALNEQYARYRRLDESVKLGMILVEHGYVSEDDLLHAINDHYGLSLTSISEDLDNRLRQKRGAIPRRPAGPRLPIWLQLSVATTLIVLLTIFLLNFFILNRQKERLYQQTVKIGKVSLQYFDSNARIPLLEDNILRLNTLIKDVTKVEGLLYAIIVDHDNEIKAHSDLKLIGKPYEGIGHSGEVHQDDDIFLFKYYLPSGEHVLDLSRSIIFKDKKLGEVHVGVSIDFIERGIHKERRIIIYVTAGVILLGIGIAVFFGLRFSRPISKLVRATQQIGKGNYQHKIEVSRRDELGNLASAFNRMNQELWMKSLMQESFGKYVGVQILDMILENPESSWLKGQRSEATILFSDIRGFTSHAENKAPEEIVDELNEYFKIATSAILNHNGYIDKFIGDAVLGVFGVPAYHEDHILSAVRAAFEMQQEFEKAREYGNALLSSVGIGIDSGVVVSGNIGSPVKMEYTVIGDSVNLASHISEIAGPGEVIISKKIYEQIFDCIDVEPLPPQKVKGKSDPVETFRVLTIKELQNTDLEHRKLDTMH